MLTVAKNPGHVHEAIELSEPRHNPINYHKRKVISVISLFIMIYVNKAYVWWLIKMGVGVVPTLNAVAAKLQNRKFTTKLPCGTDMVSSSTG